MTAFTLPPFRKYSLGDIPTSFFEDPAEVVGLQTYQIGGVGNPVPLTEKLTSLLDPQLGQIKARAIPHLR